MNAPSYYGKIQTVSSLRHLRRTRQESARQQRNRLKRERRVSPNQAHIWWMNWNAHQRRNDFRMMWHGGPTWQTGPGSHPTNWMAALEYCTDNTVEIQTGWWLNDMPDHIGMDWI